MLKNSSKVANIICPDHQRPFCPSPGGEIDGQRDISQYSGHSCNESRDMVEVQGVLSPQIVHAQETNKLPRPEDGNTKSRSEIQLLDAEAQGFLSGGNPSTFVRIYPYDYCSEQDYVRLYNMIKSRGLALLRSYYDVFDGLQLENNEDYRPKAVIGFVVTCEYKYVFWMVIDWDGKYWEFGPERDPWPLGDDLVQAGSKIGRNFVEENVWKHMSS